jgi:hypothetical protein
MERAERPRYVRAPQKPVQSPLPDRFLLEPARCQGESVLQLEVELREVVDEGEQVVASIVLLPN